MQVRQGRDGGAGVVDTSAGSASDPALPGDRDLALSALFRVHHGRLVGLARILVDDQQTAEDVVQDAFVALHAHWWRLRDKDAAPAWLQTAVLNAARSQLRRRYVARRLNPVLAPVEVDGGGVEVSSAESLVLSADESRRVLGELRRLPTRQREVLALRYLMDLSETEIASRLGISAGSVKTHASRGLSSLAVRLGGTQ